MGSPLRKVQGDSRLVGVVMHLGLMGRMLVFMGPMLAGMVMVMDMHILGMAVLVRMFMNVFMDVRVGVLVGVDLVPMGVRMTMNMGMFMGMQVAVLVFPFHAKILPSEKSGVFHKPVIFILMFNPN